MEREFQAHKWIMDAFFILIFENRGSINILLNRRNLMFTASTDKTVKIWDLSQIVLEQSSKKVAFKLTIFANSQEITIMCSPDKRIS